MSIFKRIKNALILSTKEDYFLDLYKEINSKDEHEYSFRSLKKYDAYQKIHSLANDDKVELVLVLIRFKKANQQNFEYRKSIVLDALLKSIISDTKFDEIQLGDVIDIIIENKSTIEYHSIINFFPLNSLLNSIKKIAIESKISESLILKLEELKTEINNEVNYYYQKEKLKTIARIEEIIFDSSNDNLQIKPFKFLGEDEFASFANQQIEEFKSNVKHMWFDILRLAQKATGAKPTLKFRNESKLLLDKLDSNEFKQVVTNWFEYIISSKDIIPTQQYHVGHFAITSVNVEVIKGLVWMSSILSDSKLIQVISQLAERSYKKIPNVGPASASLGNACLYVLYKSDGLEGIGQLSKLKLRIKQNNIQSTIEKYLYQTAEEKGISIHEIEDLAMDEYGLENGMKKYHLGTFTASVNILSIGKTELKWIKPDGGYQKSLPTLVKDSFTEDYKNLKNDIKQIEQGLSVQRDRLDRMFRSDRTMSFEHFEINYLNHGLMSFIAKNLIWIFQTEIHSQELIFANGQWMNNQDEHVNPSINSQVSLWHPTKSNIQNIKKWRSFLEEKKIQQPLKQAFREVYILTDAEVNTKSYSNRMAAHLLKQHQFSMLAKMRGWKYTLLGAFDNGVDHGIASIELKEHNLHAEYWVNEVNAEDSMTDIGIWKYVATDQVRFLSSTNLETVDLINIPPIVFSEIMRDVDLFVGVSSVGNDPAWQDSGGLPAYRNYWESYSFGDLNEIAKTRKEILLNLIPRLKIKHIAEVKDKFLIVKGKIKTYKIHIGSTNILMEPNDQYLCIVPDRKEKNVTENLFLPFEGDSGLSVILSKAFLLADDDKITDKTILSQIN